MREWEIGAVENIHGALPYIRFAPILALVGVGVNRIGKEQTSNKNQAVGTTSQKPTTDPLHTGSKPAISNPTDWTPALT